MEKIKIALLLGMCSGGTLVYASDSEPLLDVSNTTSKRKGAMGSVSNAVSGLGQKVRDRLAGVTVTTLSNGTVQHVQNHDIGSFIKTGLTTITYTMPDGTVQKTEISKNGSGTVLQIGPHNEIRVSGTITSLSDGTSKTDEIFSHSRVSKIRDAKGSLTIYTQILNTPTERDTKVFHGRRQDDEHLFLYRVLIDGTVRLILQPSKDLQEDVNKVFQVESPAQVQSQKLEDFGEESEA